MDVDNVDNGDNGILVECKELFDSEDFGECESIYKTERARKVMAGREHLNLAFITIGYSEI